MADLCRNGLHEMTPENTLTRGQSHRCRLCRNAYQRVKYATDAAYRERAKANAARRYARIMSDPELHEKEKERNRTRTAEDQRHPVKGEMRRQRCREYRARMSTDPEWVARQRQLHRDNALIRYATDTEYRERILRQSRESAHRIRALKRATVSPGTSVTIPADLGDALDRLGGQ